MHVTDSIGLFMSGDMTSFHAWKSQNTICPFLCVRSTPPLSTRQVSSAESHIINCICLLGQVKPTLPFNVESKIPWILSAYIRLSGVWMAELEGLRKREHRPQPRCFGCGVAMEMDEDVAFDRSVHISSVYHSLLFTPSLPNHRWTLLPTPVVWIHMWIHFPCLGTLHHPI